MTVEPVGYRDWTARPVVSDELIDPSPVAALAALFDDGLAAPAPGDRLPPLWHWVALPRWSPSTRIGTDGHPVRGDFLPPVDLPRRMFAGGRVSFLAPLRVGDSTRRESVVESVTEKSGRSGSLVIVVVATTLHTPDGEPAVVEHQNLIYREPAPENTGAAIDPAASAALAPVGSPFVREGDDWSLRTDPSLLMRFSAATANAHRIHYDWPYATGVEGYPGLVVHGPLMTLALAETHRLAGDPRSIATLAHRNTAPLFCGRPARLHSGDGGASLAVIGADGPHATADLTFHPDPEETR